MLRTRGQLFSDYLGGIGVRTNMGFGPKTGTWGRPGLVQLRRRGATAVTAEDTNFGAAEAAANGE